MSTVQPQNNSYTYYLNVSNQDTQSEVFKSTQSSVNSNAASLKSNLSQIDTELLNLKKKIYKLESSSNIKTISKKNSPVIQKQRISLPRKITHCSKCSCQSEPRLVIHKETPNQNEQIVYNLSEQLKLKETIITNLVNDINILKNKLAYEQKINVELSEQIAHNDEYKDRYERELLSLKEQLMLLQKDNDTLSHRNYCIYCNHCNGINNYNSKQRNSYSVDMSNRGYQSKEEEKNQESHREITFRKKTPSSKDNNEISISANTNITEGYAPKYESSDSYTNIIYSNPERGRLFKDNTIIDRKNSNTNRLDSNDNLNKTKKILSINNPLEEDQSVPKINKYQTESLPTKYNIPIKPIKSQKPKINQKKKFQPNTKGQSKPIAIKEDNSKINELISKINKLNEELSNNKKELNQSKSAIEKLKEENKKTQLNNHKRKSSENILALKSTNFEYIQKANEIMPDYFSSTNIHKQNNSNNASFLSTQSKKSSWMSKLKLTKNSMMSTSMTKANEDYSKVIFTVYDKTKILSFDSTEKQFTLIEFSDENNTFANNYYPNSSLYINVDNLLYIITGDSSDILFEFNPISKTMTKVSKLSFNHLLGGLLIDKDNNNLICLSGAYNKTVEICSLSSHQWELGASLTIERSECGYSIVNSKSIYAFFGYNCPQNKYIDTIEYCEDYTSSSKWKSINILNKSNLNLHLKGHSIFYIEKDKRFVLLGGMEGENDKPNETYLDILIEKNKTVEIKPTRRKLFSISKNKLYSFSNDAIGKSIEEKEIGFYDSKKRMHYLNRKNMLHDIFYFD